MGQKKGDQNGGDSRHPGGGRMWVEKGVLKKQKTMWGQNKEEKRDYLVTLERVDCKRVGKKEVGHGGGTKKLVKWASLALGELGYTENLLKTTTKAGPGSKKHSQKKSPYHT